MWRLENENLLESQNYYWLQMKSMQVEWSVTKVIPSKRGRGVSGSRAKDEQATTRKSSWKSNLFVQKVRDWQFEREKKEKKIPVKNIQILLKKAKFQILKKWPLSSNVILLVFSVFFLPFFLTYYYSVPQTRDKNLFWNVPNIKLQVGFFFWPGIYSVTHCG